MKDLTSTKELVDYLSDSVNSDMAELATRGTTPSDADHLRGRIQMALEVVSKLTEKEVEGIPRIVY